jgi:hypothetical protein
MFQFPGVDVFVHEQIHPRDQFQDFVARFDIHRWVARVLRVSLVAKA